MTINEPIFRVKSAFLTLIHTTPYLADVVYAVRRWMFRWVASHRREKHLPDGWLDRIKFVPSFRLCISATNQCNAACTFCVHPKIKNLRGYMPVELFKTILDQWRQLGGTQIDFTVSVGEPTLDTNLLEKIRLAHQCGIKTSFTTNGTLLHRNELYKKLVEAGVVQIHISLDVPEEDLYRKSFGVNQAENVRKGVSMLLDYNEQCGSPVQLVLRFRSSLKPRQIIRSSFFQQIVKPRVGANVLVYFTHDYDNWGGLITESDMVGAMTLAPIAPKPKIPCRQLFEPAVEWNGNIRLCACRTAPGSSDLVVGNIRTMSIAEAVVSPEGRRIVQSFLDGNPPNICKNCTMYRPIL